MSNQEKTIKIWIDGGSSGNPGRGAVAFIVDAGNKGKHLEAYEIGEATNNEAEYKALLDAVCFLSEWKENEDIFLSNISEMDEIKQKYDSIFRNCHIIIFSDSQLIVNQLKGLWKIDKKFQGIVDLIKQDLNEFKSWEIKWIPKEENKICDGLVKLMLYKKL
jgi:ribonuclease HI